MKSEPIFLIKANASVVGQVGTKRKQKEKV